MARKTDTYRVRCAQMAGAIAGLRDALVLDREDRLGQLRTFWPQLASRVEAAAALADSRDERAIVDERAMFAFETQVWTQCGFALRAYTEARTEAEPWYGLQNFVTAVANISKVFWGQGGKFRAEREVIRERFGVRDDSPIQETTMRNHWEHFDERIATWAAQPQRGPFVDMNVTSGPAGIGGLAVAGFRNYDCGRDVLMYGREELHVGRIAAEVAAIFDHHPNLY